MILFNLLIINHNFDKIEYSFVLYKMANQYDYDLTYKLKYHNPFQMLWYSYNVYYYADQYGVLDRGHLALFAATIDQQSKFQYDALSKNDNFRCRWNQYDPDCDYGLTQIHGYVAKDVADWLGNHDFKISDLKQSSLAIQYMILIARVQEYGPYKRFHGRISCKKCIKISCSYKKRCETVAKCASIRYGTRNSNSESLCKFVSKYWRIKKHLESIFK